MPGLVAATPAGQGGSATEQQHAAEPAQRGATGVGIDVEQAGPAGLQPGEASLQCRHVAQLRIFVHDPGIGTHHRLPAFRVGPSAWIDVSQVDVQLRQDIFTDRDGLVLDTGRVVALCPEQLEELRKALLVGRRRRRPIGGLAGQEFVVIQLPGYRVRFLVLGQPLQRAFVHQVEIGTAQLSLWHWLQVPTQDSSRFADQSLLMFSAIPGAAG